MEHSLRSAVLAVCRPLVRYLIGQGVTYSGFCQLLKVSYVQEAERIAGTEKRAVTDSQVALLSGVHRKEVARLRSEVDVRVDPSNAANLAARVVAEWVTRSEFLDTHGHPRRLPVKVTADSPSFDDLVRLVKADLRARVVLDELVRVGVAVHEGGTVRLVRTAYVSDLSREKLHFLGANVGDHLASAIHNLNTREDAFIERAVYYDSLSAESLTSLRPVLFRKADRFLRESNRAVMPLDDDTLVTGRKRLRVGVYYYEEDSGIGTHQGYEKLK